MTSTRISEANDVAKPIVAHLRTFPNASIRQELPIVLNGTTALLDCLCRIVKPDREDFIAVEFKVGITDELIEQAERWIGKANQVFVGVYEPEKMSNRHKSLRNRLASLGIGLFYARGGIATISIQAPWGDADTRLLSHAFSSHDGSNDPKAGVAGAKRITQARSMWDVARGVLRVHGPMSWKMVQLHAPGYRIVTEHQAVKAVKTGDFMGADYDRKKSPTEFYATGETK